MPRGTVQCTWLDATVRYTDVCLIDFFTTIAICLRLLMILQARLLLLSLNDYSINSCLMINEHISQSATYQATVEHKVVD